MAWRQLHGRLDAHDTVIAVFVGDQDGPCDDPHVRAMRTLATFARLGDRDAPIRATPVQAGDPGHHRMPVGWFHLWASMGMKYANT
jgi:hypothetical protein